MSDKITIQDIIELLTEKHGMTKKDAETFVKGMFELIEEALATEKYVKVKGLGTFKLTEVGSRESVNVNTGERIEIQGHTKISFTPDTTMKDLINKPFAHFETVVLNEGTMLEDTVTEIEGEEDEKEEIIEEVTTENPEEGVVAEEVKTIEEIEVERPQEEVSAVAEAEAETIKLQEAETEENGNLIEEVKEAEITSTVEEEPAAEESIIPLEIEEEIVNTEEEVVPTEPEESAPVIPAVEASIENIIEEEVKGETVEETVTESEPQQEEETMTIADAAMMAAREEKTLSEVIASEDINQKEEEPEAPIIPQEKVEEIKKQEETGEKKAKTPWGIIIAIILILCIAGCIYCYLQPGDKKELPQTPATSTTSQANESNATPIQPQDSLAQDNDTVNLPVHTPEKEAVQQPQQTTPAVTQQPASGTTTAGNKEVAKVTLADTVEYDITGTKTNYTLQEGESLIKVAVKFYGTKKLWPYIVKHNKDVIKDADRVPIGTTLRIPELSPKK
ncbi:MAG: HU family DNA-binding protein [Bacteroides sp.]|nr:HU family DNA-binding protein [Bacteroides sp.]